MSLVARHLEANGITTIIIGSAIDIVSHCGVPRYLHTDFPLGNPCGKPYDIALQTAIVHQALDLTLTAATSNTIARAPFKWSDDNGWRDAYLRVDDTNRERLRELGAERRKFQAEKKTSGEQRAPMLYQE